MRASWIFWRCEQAFDSFNYAGCGNSAFPHNHKPPQSWQEVETAPLLDWGEDLV